MLSLYPVRLPGTRLTLREFESDDLAAVHAWSCDADALRFLRWGPNEPADTAQHLDRLVDLAAAEPRLEYTLGLMLSGSGSLVGSISLRLSPEEDDVADVGYVLRRDHWGKGLMTEALQLIAGFAVNDLGLRRITAVCDPDNVASARVLEKSRFVFQHVIKDHVVVRGELRDSRFYIYQHPVPHG